MAPSLDETPLIDVQQSQDFTIEPNGKPMLVKLEKMIMEKPHPPKEIRQLKLTYLTWEGEVRGEPQIFRLGLQTWEEARDLRKRLEALTRRSVSLHCTQTCRAGAVVADTSAQK
mgnify:CR=1 FL=1